MFLKQRKLPPENPLLKEIDRAKNELEAAYSQFENVVDPDLINCSIYKINAIQERYSFLLKQMKMVSAAEGQQNTTGHRKKMFVWHRKKAFAGHCKKAFTE